MSHAPTSVEHFRNLPTPPLHISTSAAAGSGSGLSLFARRTAASADLQSRLPRLKAASRRCGAPRAVSMFSRFMIHLHTTGSLVRLNKCSCRVSTYHGKCGYGKREILIFSPPHFCKSFLVSGRILHFENPVKYKRIFEINRSGLPGAAVPMILDIKFSFISIR